MQPKHRHKYICNARSKSNHHYRMGITISYLNSGIVIDCCCAVTVSRNWCGRSCEEFTKDSLRWKVP
ncbi:hypothetical protein VTL71DRAFT_15216 [Oculimacula yallundae]|uniref:Uncharacterized protein n=1 Tax=Oculimacula yallundae TaxID=86028 RepID=A0ABR4CG15_9HELO